MSDTTDLLLGFEFGGQVSYFSFHWSYFGLFARIRPANSPTILRPRFMGSRHWLAVQEIHPRLDK